MSTRKPPQASRRSSEPFKGRVGAVLLLGMSGADVGSCDKYGDPSLCIAAVHGHLDVAKCLVEQLEVDVNQKTTDGKSAFFRAIQENQIAVARF